MREITQKIYNFNELDKEIQKKLIEKEKENQKELFCECFLLEDMQEKAKELLNKYFGQKATFDKVYYDLSYCQGSGAMISFHLEYYNKYVNVVNYGRYSHEYSFVIEHDNLTDKQEKKLKEKIYEMNCELSKYGYDLIEFEYKDNEIIEILNDNEYFENGEIYL